MSPPGRAGGRVIVVGSVNVDLVVTVDRLPAPGQTVIGGRFARHHGGKGGNQAVAAARMGAATWFVGAVGDDDLGVAAREALAGEGIDVWYLAIVGGAATGVASILVDRAGENSIAVAGGANAALTEAGVVAALGRLAPRVGDVVLVGHEIPTAAAVAALRAGRQAGATTILNPAPADGLTVEAVGLVDVLTPNRGEAEQLARSLAGADGGTEDGGAEGVGESGAEGGGAGGEPSTGMRFSVIAEALRSRLAPGGSVLLTLGGDGALLVTPEVRVDIGAAVVDVVDTVGAGDTLNGALAAGLAAGIGLEEASRRAVAAASMAVTVAGAREGMPTLDALDRDLEVRG